MKKFVLFISLMLGLGEIYAITTDTMKVSGVLSLNKDILYVVGKSLSVENKKNFQEKIETTDTILRLKIPLKIRSYFLQKEVIDSIIQYGKARIETRKIFPRPTHLFGKDYIVVDYIYLKNQNEIGFYQKWERTQNPHNLYTLLLCLGLSFLFIKYFNIFDPTKEVKKTALLYTAILYLLLLLLAYLASINKNWDQLIIVTLMFLPVTLVILFKKNKK